MNYKLSMTFLYENRVSHHSTYIKSCLTSQYIYEIVKVLIDLSLLYKIRKHKIGVGNINSRVYLWEVFFGGGGGVIL